MTANKFEIITKAIHAINPSAEFVLRDTNDDINIDNETFTIDWHKGDAISKADIKMSSEFGTLNEDGTIKTTTGEKVKGISYSVLYMKAIKALQEAMAKIETLETKVKALEDA